MILKIREKCISLLCIHYVLDRTVVVEHKLVAKMIVKFCTILNPQKRPKVCKFFIVVALFSFRFRYLILTM